MVIGLGLCLFAEKVFKAGLVRFVVCPSSAPADVLTRLSQELAHLAATPREACETTLLLVPDFLPEFLDFNDFLGDADALLETLALTGTVQIVGFHPGFQYAGATADAPENYTNRSPHPLFHLLREVSVSEVAETSDLLAIAARNDRTLRKLGVSGILDRIRSPLG